MARSQGLRIFPCYSGTKYPIAVHGFESTEVEIAAAFERAKGREYNLAVVAGAVSGGVVGLDCETEEVARQLFPNFEEQLRRTWCIRTPHGGVVILVRATREVPRRSIRPAGEEHEFDICGSGGYFLIWGAIDHTKCDPSKKRCPHVGTSSYETISQASTIYEMREVGEGLRVRCAELGWTMNSRTWPKISEISRGVGEGSRNNAAFTMARFLRHTLGMEPGDGVHALAVWNQRNRPPLPERELAQIVEGVWRYSPAKTNVAEETIPKGSAADQRIEEVVKRALKL